nr:Dam family site-specific DNA-(adenine-N6)-methyltransferase [Pantoea allii]
MTTTNIPHSFDVSAFIEKARTLVRTTYTDTKPSPGALPAFNKRPKLAIVPATLKTPIRPLYKWQGGKTKLLKAYAPHLPSAESFSYYVEPFFGAGALFCHVKNTYAHKPSVINDINPYVVNVLNTLQSYPYLFIKRVKEIESDYLAIQAKEDRRAFFYDLRSQYWSYEERRKLIPEAVSLNITCAAYLYFLMKTSFNGLWQPMRTRNDFFGTAFGLGNEEPGFIDYALIQEWHEQLQDTHISCCSYEELNIPPNSFVFCDPPYIDNTVSYGAKRIDALSLLNWCEQLQRNGSTVWLANRHVETSFYEDFSTYDQKHVYDVSYTGGKKTVSSKKEVLLIWNKKQNNVALAA